MGLLPGHPHLRLEVVHPSLPIFSGGDTHLLMVKGLVYISVYKHIKHQPLCQ